MQATGVQAEQLHTLSFHMQSVEQVTIKADNAASEKMSSCYTLLVCSNGNGKLYLKDEVLLFDRFSSYLLPPYTYFQFKSSNQKVVSYYKIHFVITQISEPSPPRPFQAELFPTISELKVHPVSEMLEMTEKIYRNGWKQKGLSFFGQNVMFLQMIHFIMSHHIQSDERANAIQAVEGSIRYLQENYADKITVSMLESLSGVPNGQYSTIFKELTGMKPLDYVTDLRIKHAQHLLLQSKESLSHIAKQVGFTDEYYFNRKFRQMTGLPPRQYAVRMKGSIRINDWKGNEVTMASSPSRVIFYGETVEDLLALGIQPIGGGICVGERQFDFDSAELLKPDLIILDNESQEDYERFSQIAPTLTYNSFASIEARLSLLGRWFGKEKEADEWIEDYRRRKDMMWQGLSSTIRKGETATVFIYHRGKQLFVMGNVGLTSVLYHPNGFEPVRLVKEMLNEELPYKEITRDDLPNYAGDRVFMLTPSSPSSRDALEETLSSSEWQQLESVKKGLVYQIDVLNWNCYDANTFSKVIDKLPRLLQLGITE
ncbi:AraC family transcriptional regulator [Paenibacillus sp. GSMTC-2017]|uniref:helix-turn-helix domain-containing protein n=1 Tax=Paenibacillus sp. GSMTC-2017 TaxID=2794350 RepID=UPI0018D9EB39|nr:helix-turn-helix domain-containing protein [Paenibacillus sp. GSMTC-2017]MBH5318838.1 AraC family transcriptional regulator [Paenibacillus sp. GSMTC-2017]